MSVAGGKWTTYRAMAQEGVDACVKQFGFSKFSAFGARLTFGPWRVVLIIIVHFVQTLVLAIRNKYASSVAKDGARTCSLV